MNELLDDIPLTCRNCQCQKPKTEDNCTTPYFAEAEFDERYRLAEGASYGGTE